MDNWGPVCYYMTYLVHPKRNWRWKTLRVPVRKRLLSGKHVCSPQRNPLAARTARKANAVCLNADSQHLSPPTGENFACILEFALFHLILYATVNLTASFTAMFNGNICLGKQDDGCVALQALAGLQGLSATSGADKVVWQSSKLEAETFKVGWMAGGDQSEDKEILKCRPGQSEKRKVSRTKHASGAGDVSKHFQEILPRCQLTLSVSCIKAMLTATGWYKRTLWVSFFIVSGSTSSLLLSFLLYCHWRSRRPVTKAVAHPLLDLLLLKSTNESYWGEKPL